MDEPTTIPKLEEIAARIKACRDELQALKRLHRLLKANAQANDARIACGPRCAPEATNRS